MIKICKMIVEPRSNKDGDVVRPILNLAAPMGTERAGMVSTLSLFESASTSFATDHRRHGHSTNLHTPATMHEHIQESNLGSFIQSSFSILLLTNQPCVSIVNRDDV